MSPRLGRPPSDNPRRNLVNLRLTDDELAAFRAAAEDAGVQLGVWVRERALEGQRVADKRRKKLGQEA